jgi:histidinol-phosphate aminotransferase
VLAHTFAALLNHDKPLVFPDITYSFYPVYAKLTGVRFETVALDADLRLHVEDYRRPCGAIILANPNAPSGVALDLAEIASLVDDHPDVPVVIDEAYIDFGGESALKLLPGRPNLLVVRTMSKSRALAGLRVGYAIGEAGLVEALTRVKDSFNSYPLGRPAQAGATASVQDEPFLRDTIAKVIKTREAMTRGLTELGFVIPPSSANFVFARPPRLSGAEWTRALRERRVLVRNFQKPRIADYLRISVGSDSDVAALLDACYGILHA